MNAEPFPNPAADDDPGPLLLTPLAEALAAAAPNAESLQRRLAGRVAATQAAAAGKLTQRQRRLQPQAWAPGVHAASLYQADPGAVRRPGEPLRAMLLTLAPGSRWQAPAAPGVQREWLVLHGAAHAGCHALTTFDYLITPAGAEAPLWLTEGGARLFLREAPQPSDSAAHAPAEATVVRDAEAGWPAFAPGVERRVLWQRGREAALLYRAAAGASVPHHVHGHDEECLMVRGDLFLDDLLLQEGDYQIAPAGSDHVSTFTDVGAVLYAHGDFDLNFV